MADGERRGRMGTTAGTGRLAVAGVAALVVVGAGALIWGRRSEPAATGTAAQHVAVPAYVQTAKTADWDRLLAQDSATVQVLVVNVADGPGTTADPAWQDVITRANQAGKRVLGYVDSGYFGSDDAYNQRKQVVRSATGWRDEAVRNIDRWHQLYTGIGGVFIDNGTWACGPIVEGVETEQYVDLYRDLDARSDQHGGELTILNPGAAPKPCMERAADTLVSWEGTASQYLGVPRPGEAAHEFTAVAWDPPPAPGRFWHIVYDVAPDQVAAVVDLSRQRGAGWVFVTDDKGDWKQNENPFDDVPLQLYWDDVLGRVRGTG